MNERRPNLTSELRSDLKELELAILARAARPETFLRDVAALDFAQQTMEAGAATASLSEGPFPQMAYVTARYAFEATHDLIYLLEVLDDALEAGALAYAGGLVSSQRSIALLDRAAGEPEEDRAGPGTPALKPLVDKEAKYLEAHYPGSGEALVRAFNHSRSGYRHWSGLTRRGITGAIRDKWDHAPIEAMFEGYYDRLAVMAHPRSRLGDTLKLTSAGLVYEPGEFPADPGPIGAARASARTARQLLELHLHAAEPG